jgi:hypothetical protein
MAYINASGEMDNALGLLDRIQIAKVTLTAAQIQAMFGAPISVLPIPTGSQPNQVYYILSVSMQVTPGSIAFLAGGPINLVYHGTGISPTSASLPAATVLATTPSNNFLPMPSGVIQPPTNIGIDITNTLGAFTTGNGTITLKIRFSVQAVD